MRKFTLNLVVVLVVLLSLGALVSAAAPGYPILVTSAGQSPDDLILKVMLDRQLDQEVERDPLAEKEGLEGMNTVVLAVGVSNKGLGAAGLNLDQEKARISSLLQAAKELDCYVILVHVGGQSRRGTGSDEVARLVAAGADYMIVVVEGNQDQFFDQLGEEHGIPLKVVESRNDVATAVGELLQ